MGPEAPARDDGFSSVFPSDSWGGINHHMFQVGVSGVLQRVLLDYHWSFRGSPAFYREIVVLGTSTKLILQGNPSRIISDWFEGSVLLQSRSLQV